MPKGILNEDIWKKAKHAFKDQNGKEPSSDKDYKLVMGIYKRMGGQIKEEESSDLDSDFFDSPLTSSHEKSLLYRLDSIKHILEDYV